MEIHPYGQAFTDRDHARTVELLADDVVFHSPVIGDTAFEGRASTAALLEIVFREMTDIEVTHGWGDAEAQVLVANATVRGKRIKVSTLLELNAGGGIREIWILARPMVGV